MKKQRKNYIEIEEACNHLYVTTIEIMTILGGVSKNKADTFRKEVEKILDKEKCNALTILDEKEKNKKLAQCYYIKDTKPHLLPIQRVLEHAHIDLDYVRKEANKMRRAMRLEGKNL